MVLQTSPNFNVFTKCSNAHLSKVIYKSLNILLLCIHRCQHWCPLTAVLQHCSTALDVLTRQWLVAAAGSCSLRWPGPQPTLITIPSSSADADASTDASTDTIWFLLTSLCQGCQGIFRYTVVNSTQIVLLLLLWRSQRWTFESRPRIHILNSKYYDAGYLITRNYLII